MTSLASCSSNSECLQGECCEASPSSQYFNHCLSSPSLCYSLDGSLNFNQPCTSNSQCATNCCSKLENLCLSSNCMAPNSASMSQLAIILISLAVVLISIIAVILALIFYRKCKRKKRRSSSTILPQSAPFKTPRVNGTKLKQ